MWLPLPGTRQPNAPGGSCCTEREDRLQLQGSEIYNEKFDNDQRIEDISSAVTALRARPECTGKVGALGFCLGGKLSYLSACRSDVDCAVSCYGVTMVPPFRPRARLSEGTSSGRRRAGRITHQPPSKPRSPFCFRSTVAPPDAVRASGS